MFGEYSRWIRTFQSNCNSFCLVIKETCSLDLSWWKMMCFLLLLNTYWDDSEQAYCGSHTFIIIQSQLQGQHTWRDSSLQDKSSIISGCSWTAEASQSWLHIWVTWRSFLFFIYLFIFFRSFLKIGCFALFPNHWGQNSRGRVWVLFMF